MSQPKRERALRSFTNGSVPVLVATNIAARGIHVDGVDTVIHHDPPEDTKTYLHRSGRTARAGASGLVVTLVGPEQLRAVNILRREAGVRESVVAMAPGDLRLTDLAAWTPPEDDHSPRQGGSSGGLRFTQNGRFHRSNGPEGGQQRRWVGPPRSARMQQRPQAAAGQARYGPR